MKGGNSGLADLVTQADDPPPPQQQPQPQPRQEHCNGEDRGGGGGGGGGGGFLARLCCGCARRRGSQNRSKLSSVVPTAQEEDGDTAVETSRGGDDSAGYGLAIWGPNKNEYPQLGPQVGRNVGRKTLVLDLDETLVHSSFRTTASADIIISVELEGEDHSVYVRKRPGVDEFMLKVAQMYEVVVYTASMAKYANPLLDELDPYHTVSARLFREACTRHPGGYVKDLSRMGRDLKDVIIIDNSPICYALQPDNAIPIRTWKDDPRDQELLELIPILRSLKDVEDIPEVLRQTVWCEE
mmetsp:Transcript_18287/g.39078  ORF Transcript_18287/g.39078 Transcript_18287/m.39078 type:complete len:297 (-) Transcript_18287:401-1291(-)|eukprot:CAMPEP_0206473350 /NCGR_PEP_ID=MMETSP0324_2-20121206/32803_1 /ASSEMBLY_ACC=CAM_ASM_000836 /TAXON_ID=2866 /ORGANISM="Crypthecodinium cohnii, Strain Seligo" /LENGTH=296 /DNA_ID=CAMNT_0053948243 /DNA_START=92 /DNA_END=982 /DNA_ORIENTATION=+